MKRERNPVDGGGRKEKKIKWKKRKEKYQKTSLVNENFKLSFWQLWIKIIFEKKWFEWGHSSKLKEDEVLYN